MNIVERLNFDCYINKLVKKQAKDVILLNEFTITLILTNHAYDQRFYNISIFLLPL